MGDIKGALKGIGSAPFHHEVVHEALPIWYEFTPEQRRFSACMIGSIRLSKEFGTWRQRYVDLGAECIPIQRASPSVQTAVTYAVYLRE